jgi:hypothetical protein
MPTVRVLAAANFCLDRGFLHGRLHATVPTSKGAASRVVPPFFWFFRVVAPFFSVFAAWEPGLSVVARFFRNWFPRALFSFTVARFCFS